MRLALRLSVAAVAICCSCCMRLALRQYAVCAHTQVCVCTHIYCTHLCVCLCVCVSVCVSLFLRGCVSLSVRGLVLCVGGCLCVVCVGGGSRHYLERRLL
jgi:hypothetical protein